MNRIFFIFAALTTATLHAEWQTSRGVTVWTQYRNKERSFSWTGGVDPAGKADGPGAYTVFSRGVKVVEYRGTMSEGRMNGHVQAIYYKTNQSYEGELRDGSENGYGVMTYSDGTRTAGQWQDGKLVEASNPKVESAGAPSAKQPMGEGRTPANTPASGEIVELTPGIESTRNNPGANTKLLYGLSVLTRHYLLDIAYKRGVGNATIDDAYWARGRGIRLAHLMADDSTQGASPEIREFCQRALALDAAFQMTYETIIGADDSSRDEGLSFLYRYGKRQLGQGRDDEGGGGDFFSMLSNIYRNVENGANAFNDFVTAKNKIDRHRQWAQILQKVSADDPSLRPFANEPRVTDPTWHFMRLRETHDVFFGQSIASRAREDEAPVLRTARERYVGDLSKGAIRVRFSSHEKAFAYRLQVDGPKHSRPVFVADCERGHYGLTDTNESTWVSRGLVDSQNNGVGGFPVRAQGLLVYHFPIFGVAEDLDTRGAILMYLQEMYATPADANAAARDAGL